MRSRVNANKYERIPTLLLVRMRAQITIVPWKAQQKQQ